MSATVTTLRPPARRTADDDAQPVYLDPAAQAVELAHTLAQYGFTAQALIAQAHHLHPCVKVTGSYVRHVPSPEYVYAAPDEDGAWWFWRPKASDPLDMEPVAPISEVSVTADQFSRSFAVVVPSDTARAAS